MKGKRISDLLNPRRGEVNIKDYAKIEYVFNLYLDEKYDTMAREIYLYSEFEFFKELAVYLRINFKTAFCRQFYYRDMWELFDERLDDVHNEIQLRKARKKYRL